MKNEVKPFTQLHCIFKKKKEKKKYKVLIKNKRDIYIVDRTYILLTINPMYIMKLVV